MSVEALATRCGHQLTPGRNRDPVTLHYVHLDHTQRAAIIATAFPTLPVAAGG